MSSNDNIMLLENYEILREPQELCNVFNEYFVNIAKDIGVNDRITLDDSVTSIITEHDTHPSIDLIRRNHANDSNFQFSDVSSNDIRTILKKLNIRKATGCDNIPPKLLRIGAEILCSPITYLVNMAFRTSCFPDMLKQAEVTPIYKKNDVMDKRNYRPVSILPTVSKIFEKVMLEQLNVHFDPILSPYMSGFRKGYSCENVLLHFVESAKSALDDKKTCRGRNDGFIFGRSIAFRPNY